MTSTARLWCIWFLWGGGDRERSILFNDCASSYVRLYSCNDKGIKCKYVALNTCNIHLIGTRIPYKYLYFSTFAISVLRTCMFGAYRRVRLCILTLLSSELPLKGLWWRLIKRILAKVQGKNYTLLDFDSRGCHVTWRPRWKLETQAKLS